MSWCFCKNATAPEVVEYVKGPLGISDDIKQIILARIGETPSTTRTFVSCSGHQDGDGSLDVNLHLVVNCCQADDASGNRCELPYGHSTWPGSPHQTGGGVGKWTDDAGGWHRGDGSEITAPTPAA